MKHFSSVEVVLKNLETKLNYLENFLDQIDN